MKFHPLVVAAAAAVALAGCGGDDESSRALSYSDYTAQADKICGDVSADVDSVSAKISGDPDQDAPVLGEIIPKVRSGVDRIEALDPPAELEDAQAEFVRLTERQLDGTEDAQQAAEAGDQEEYIRLLETIQAGSEEVNLAGSKLGAIECTK